MNKVEMIISRQLLELLCVTVHEFAAKFGITVAAHAAKNLLEDVSRTVREHCGCDCVESEEAKEAKEAK